MTDLLEAKTLAQHGKFDEAEAALKELVANPDPRINIPATFNMGWYDMRNGNLLEGFIKLYNGRQINVYGLPPLQTNKPIYQGGSLANKKILLRGEGGYGDMLINLRFAKELKELGAYVTFSCPRDMFTYLRRAPYIDAVVDNEMAIGADFDCWLPSMSAAQALKIEYENLSGKPYLPKPKAIPLGGEFKVGIRWGGNPKFEEELMRKLPSDKLCELANIPGTSVYSLQHGNDLINLPENVVDLSPLMKDWDATAQLVSGLDLVITSCTSIAHLAAGMGIETWVLTPTLAYYIWAVPGDKSPWYDSVKLFRQEVFGDWDKPLSEIEAALKEKLHGRKTN